MLNKVIKLSTIVLGLFCSVFMIFTSVHAASQQASQVSTTVTYTPGILVRVEAIVDDGDPEIIFDNYTGIALNNTHFSATPGLPSSALTSPSVIKFKITNYTENKDIVASVELVNNAPQGVFMEIIDESKTEVKTNQINRKEDKLPANSGETNTFHLISYFQNAEAHLIIRIQAVNVQE